MKTVLVVDDEFSMLWVLESLLQDEGYATRTASNGQEALERSAEERPDLILTDVMMPRLSGLELVRRLADHPELRSVPVVLMSSMSRDAVEAKLPLDGRAFLRKPFELDALLRCVRERIGPPA